MRAVLVAFFALFGPVLLAQAEKWPTTQIDVYKGDSGFFTPDDEDDLPGDSEVRKLEAFLSYAARQMQDMGFPAPALEVIKTDTCKACYRIYLDEIALAFGELRGQTTNTGWAFTTGTYDVITIDRGKALSKDERKILPAAYITGAHELFHAVQDRTTYLYDDNPAIEPNPAGNWISEGTAEAIALYLFETYPARASIAPNPLFIEGVSQKKQFGGRLYSEPLPAESDDEASNRLAGYRTSSFWRYLAEVWARRKTGTQPGLPGPGDEKADFSYLVKLLSVENKGDEPWEELRWLKETLRKPETLGARLDETYARFLTTLAGYANHRHSNQNISEEDWLRMFFGECVTLPFRPGQNSDRKTVKLPEMAGICVRVVPAGADTALSFDLHIDTAVEAETNQIWVGTDNGQILTKRIWQEWDPKVKADTGLWPGLVTDPKDPAIFIVTNAANPAELTRPTTISLQATAGTREKEAAAAPSKSTKGDPGPDGREEDVKERVLAAGNKLTGNGQFSMQIDRTDTDMTIHLGLAPQALDAAFGTSGSGGVVDQMLTKGGSLGNVSAAVQSAYLSGTQTIGAGDDVYIRMPRIDYGFTGTVEGVNIYTTGADGSQLYAIGPTDSLPGPQREFRPSGRVTILSFTPRMLIARYEADFVDPFSLTPSQMQQSRPTLDVKYSGRERFAISAPMARMNETGTTMPVDPWADLESDLAKRLPPDLSGAAAAITEEAKRASEEDREPDFSSIRSGPGAPAGSCDCSCAGLDALNRMGEAVEAEGRAPTAAEQSLAMCAMTCSAQYAVCEGD